VRVTLEVQFTSGGRLTAEVPEGEANEIVLAVRQSPDSGTVTMNFGGPMGKVMVRCAAVACVAVRPL
jgi:hypothetical protein